MASDQEPGSLSVQRIAHPPAAFRSPQRITITAPNQLYQRLVERSNCEGRSLRNLAAFLLEQCCCNSLYV